MFNKLFFHLLQIPKHHCQHTHSYTCLLSKSKFKSVTNPNTTRLQSVTKKKKKKSVTVTVTSNISRSKLNILTKQTIFRLPSMNYFISYFFFSLKYFNSPSCCTQTSNPRSRLVLSFDYILKVPQISSPS